MATQDKKTTRWKMCIEQRWILFSFTTRHLRRYKASNRLDLEVTEQCTSCPGKPFGEDTIRLLYQRAVSYWYSLQGENNAIARDTAADCRSIKFDFISKGRLGCGGPSNCIYINSNQLTLCGETSCEERIVLYWLKTKFNLIYYFAKNKNREKIPWGRNCLESSLWTNRANSYCLVNNEINRHLNLYSLIL